ncbi:MAG: NAD-dependent deacylase [Caldilineaceae bacterium]|nr:NAD-dependent deacylase [Caldilineaceae bacterium]
MGTVETAQKLLGAAQRVVCLTGAGVSAESGVPTFRDAQTGLWARYNPERLASPQGFAEDPGLVWRWYMQRLAKVEAAQPNPGHLTLAKMERGWPGFRLITQNVDDLHERAGSQAVIHLHGRIAHFHCQRCKRAYGLQPEDPSAPQPPGCGHCRGLVRPSVVWFGEMLPAEELHRAMEAISTCDLLLVVGTSGLVYPAAQLPHLAKRAGARLIEINPQPGPLSDLADVCLRGNSGELLPALLPIA